MLWVTRYFVGWSTLVLICYVYICADPTKGHSSPEKSPQISKKQSPKHSPKQTSPKQTSGKSLMSASKPPKAVRALSIEAKEDTLPVAKQPLKQTENPVAAGIKEPGWYKQMFQDFQNTVEETYPGCTYHAVKL